MKIAFLYQVHRRLCIVKNMLAMYLKYYFRYIASIFLTLHKRLWPSPNQCGFSQFILGRKKGNKPSNITYGWRIYLSWKIYSTSFIKFIGWWNIFHKFLLTCKCPFSIQSCRSYYATQHLCQRSLHKIFVNYFVLLVFLFLNCTTHCIDLLRCDLQVSVRVT